MVFRELSKVYQQNLIKQPRFINEEFSQKIIDFNTDRLKQTSGRTANENDIRRYVTRFGELKDTAIDELKRRVATLIRTNAPPFNPFSAENSADPRFEENLKKLKVTPQDIGLYTWPQLETVVDGFKWPETDEEKKRKEELQQQLKQGYPAPVLYNNDGLVLMFAPTYQYAEAIYTWLNKIDKAREPRTPSSPDRYWFCLSVAESTFYSYRSGSNIVRSLYFVHDTKQDINSEMRVNVIQPQSDGLYLFTKASNTQGDKTYTWDQMVTVNPRLKPLKQYLTVKPLSDEEQDERIVANRVTPENFSELTKFRHKLKYISTRTQEGLPRVIFKQDFLDLPAELQHEYLQVRAMGDMNAQTILTSLTTQLFADTTMDEIQRYIELTDEKIQQNDSKWFLPFISNTTIDSSHRNETKKYYGTLLIRALKQYSEAA